MLKELLGIYEASLVNGEAPECLFPETLIFNEGWLLRSVLSEWRTLRMAEGFRIDQYEPDNSRAQARPIAAGESQTHNRHVAGDRDWTYFEARGGATYVIETFNLGPNADTVVYLYDAAGNELDSDDDRGGETWASRLEWTAPQDGVFYVMVEDWLQTSAGPGTRYDIALRTI